MKHLTANRPYRSMISSFTRSIPIVLFCCLLTLSGFAQKRVINVGVVSGCNDPSAGQFANAILEEARVLLKSDYRLVLNEANMLGSNCDPEQVKSNLNRLLANSSIDIVLGLDVISSHVLAKSGPYQKPVIAVTVLNAQVQNLPITGNGTSGVKTSPIWSYLILLYEI